MALHGVEDKTTVTWFIILFVKPRSSRGSRPRSESSCQGALPSSDQGYVLGIRSLLRSFQHPCSIVLMLPTRTQFRPALGRRYCAPQCEGLARQMEAPRSEEHTSELQSRRDLV